MKGSGHGYQAHVSVYRSFGDKYFKLYINQLILSDEPLIGSFNHQDYLPHDLLIGLFKSTIESRISSIVTIPVTDSTFNIEFTIF